MSTFQIYELMTRDQALANYFIQQRMVADGQRRIYLSHLLRRCKQQIILLKRNLRILIARFKKRQQSSLQQNLAIRIDVTEGLRSMVYETARAAADELSDIYGRTTGDIVLITVDFDDEENEELEEDSESTTDAELEQLFCRGS